MSRRRLARNPGGRSGRRQKPADPRTAAKARVSSAPEASWPRRGEVWYANLDPVQGHEQGRSRPVLIVSVDALNSGPSNLVSVVPITSNLRPITGRVALTPPEGGLQRAGMIITEQCRTISQARLARRLGRVSAASMLLVDDALRLFLGL